MLRPRLVLGARIPKAALSLRLGKSRSSKPNAARFMCSDSAAAALAKKKPAVLRCETESAQGGATVGVAGMPGREAVRGAIAQDVGNHGTPELSLSANRLVEAQNLHSRQFFAILPQFTNVTHRAAFRETVKI